MAVELNLPDPIDDAQRAIRRETEGWVEPIGRVGLVTQGLLYAIVALLALHVASGSTGDRADQQGAMYAVANQPLGRVLLLALTIGLALHCAWRVLLFLRGAPGPDDAGDLAQRVGHLGRALIYAGFTWASAHVLFDRDSGADGQREGVARILDWPAGRWLVAGVGIAIIATGIWHASKVITRNFCEKLDLDGRSELIRRGIFVLGSVGHLARGVVFGLVGWFLVQAAVQHDPNEGGGLDNALKRLADSEHGPGMLRLVAVGLLVFGMYRGVEAIYRRGDAVANA